MNTHTLATAPRARAWSHAARVLLAGSLAALLSLTACGGGGDVDRGPTTIAVAGAKLNGLFWDKNESRLYLTDEAANAIKAWDGDKGFATVATLTPVPASGASLGQLTRGPGGALYTTRFGFGTDGTVIAVPRAGVAVNLGGLDATRRRIGITTAPDGALIDGWFIKGGTGSVSELTLQANQASERELVTGLGKPVGVAVAGDQLFVADQNTAQILAYSLAAVRAQPATAVRGRTVASFTTLDGLDLMAAAADGTLFIGGSAGKLVAISPQGAVKTLASGWPGIRGLALDAANRRLFAAVVGADASSQPSIRIVPVD